MMSATSADRTPVVLILLFILVVLILLLFYLYKRLNHETHDKYTVQQLVYGDGGLRDRVMQGVAIVEARLGDRTLFQTHDEVQALSSNEDENSDKEEASEDGGEEDAGQGYKENAYKTEEKEEEHHNDSSDEVTSTKLKESVKQKDGNEEEMKKQESNEITKDKAKDNDSQQEENVKNDEGVRLLVDLNTFSGSAIWSEVNVTAL